jgi:S-DNA-T family DNA segregation ATPase FtsK/SpoIIIE
VWEQREMVAARPRLSPSGEELDVRPYEEGQLHYGVLLIDELADLIMTVQSEVETPLAMLAQKARAVGVHLVVATQRPSVNVITGLIKANFPSRIAFRVASKTDSRTILDQNGAESLLGNGDMLFLPPGEADPVRIQGAFVSSDETERLLDWYRKRAVAREAEAGEERDILEVVRELEEEETRVDVADDVLADRDELFRQAAEIVITNEAGSTSLLQRRLKIGYGRAARIIDQLHDAGIVGPADGSKPRDVLLRLQDLDGFLADE